MGSDNVVILGNALLFVPQLGFQGYRSSKKINVYKHCMILTLAVATVWKGAHVILAFVNMIKWHSLGLIHNCILYRMLCPNCQLYFSIKKTTLFSIPTALKKVLLLGIVSQRPVLSIVSSTHTVSPSPKGINWPWS